MKRLLESIVAGGCCAGVFALLNILILPVFLSAHYSINSLEVTVYTSFMVAPLAFLLGAALWWICSTVRLPWKYLLISLFFVVYVFFNAKCYPMRKVNKDDNLPSLETLLQKGR